MTSVLTKPLIVIADCKNKCLEDHIWGFSRSTAAVFYHTPQALVTPHVSDWRKSFGWTSVRIINNRAKENPQIPVLMYAKCLMQIYAAFVSCAVHLSSRTSWELLSSIDGTTKALSFTVMALSILSWSDVLSFQQWQKNSFGVQ